MFDGSSQRDESEGDCLVITLDKEILEGSGDHIGSKQLEDMGD